MSRKFVLLALALCAALSFSGCGGSSKPISISITSSSSTLDGSDSVTLTATVSNDKNSAGVSWTVSSGGGTLSNQTTTSATYTAPAATSSQQSITITATSVAKSTQTGTVTITVPAAPAVTSTSASLTGAVGSVFSVKLQASGGIPPFTWALGSGTTLPTCLTLKSDGTLTTANGLAPNASCAGSYTNLTFKATDSGTPNPLTVTSAPMTVTVTAAPAITFSPTLPAGSVGTAYVGSVAAAGGAGSLTYALASGALPPDLSLNTATGAIAGTPKAADAGTSNFAISASDAYGDTVTSASLSITITAPTITFAPSLPAATVGTAFAGSVAASGPVGAATYSIASGSLGSDLSLNASTGAITGTPKLSDVGTFTFAVKVVDAFGDTATSGSLSIVVSAPVITFPSSLSGGTVGTAYSGSVAATGPAGATTYTIASGSLGSDLSLNASTGAITGTPKASDVGTFTFTIKVVDAYGDTATSGSLSIAIAAAPAIVFGAAPSATATAGIAYSSTLSASGGAGALTYSISSNNLPTGLTLNTSSGAITGTPTIVGPVTFTAEAQDGFGDTPASQSYTITVSPGAATHFTVAATSSTTITAGGTLSFTVTALDGDGNVATGYTGTVAFTSTDSQAALPASSGLASGTGSFMATLKTAGSQTVTATDAGNATITGTTGAVTVNPAAAAALVVTAPSAATNSVPFNFMVTAKDSYNNTATGFADSVTFTSTDTSAVLPSTSSLTSGSGTFSATLKTNGSQSITATDASNSAVKGTSGAITVSNSVTITTASINPLDVGQAASQTFTAAGGSGITADYSWSWIAQGGSSLPPGLTLNTNGTIQGSPTTAGTYNLTVKVQDSGTSTSATANLSITIYAALSLSAGNSLPAGYVGVAYSGTITASGGSDPYCWTVPTAAQRGSGGGLPDGLVLPLPNAPGVTCNYISSTLPISGTPTNSPTPPYTVTFSETVTDTATGNSIGQQYTISVTTPTPVSLPNPNPSSLPSATVSQTYTGSISASGGVSPYTWSINGTSVPSDGTQVTISNGLYVYDTGGSTLSVGGTPTSTGTVDLTNVKVVDAASSNASQSYTITVNNTQNLSGQIYLTNYCNNGSGSPNLPAFTITLKDSNGNTVQTQNSDSSGNYGFTAVPNGTYTIVPSYSGPSGSSSVFYPASDSVTVSSGSQISGQNFNVALGYTVSGTYSYSGTTTAGQLYLVLSNNNCSGSGGNGTSIPYLSSSATSGSFTINGVAPGSYTLEALIDPKAPINLSEGQPNAADPTNGSGTAVTVSTYDVNSVAVALADPATPGVGSGPVLKQVSPQNSGAVIVFGGVGISSGAERYASYTLQWATTTTGFSSSNQATFKATGSNGSDVWILRSGNNNLTGSLTNGTAYYFRAMGTNAGGNSPWQYWDSNTSCTTTTCAQTVTIGA
ncbi:MAG TPA: putative Ig domain-containing protein, partial [Terracidiphilus sp.]|nr:putative Ig domain-containing protein [Terracidiphilus sp.]